MSPPPGHDNASSATPSFNGKGGTDLAAKVGKSMKRTGYSYGVSYLESLLLA